MNLWGHLRIKAAKSRHLPQITALSKSYELNNILTACAVETGFLVSTFSKSDYINFLHHVDHFYVLLKGETVLGFVLAYSSDLIQEDEWLNLLIKSRYPDPFILIKQICIRKDYVGRGLARMLYQHLFSQVSGWPLFTVIVLEPPNYRSITFHEKLGFT